MLRVINGMYRCTGIPYNDEEGVQSNIIESSCVVRSSMRPRRTRQVSVGLASVHMKQEALLLLSW